MTPRVIILPAADRDLDEQAEYYLGRNSPETAARWYDQTAATFEFLAKQSGIGTVRKTRKRELAGVRVWPVDGFERHIVFYRPIEGGIEVLRVIHGARDIDRVLGSD
jgi:toxin ParE1/3/4